MTVYMKVTKDEYELPVAVADSVSMLAQMLGISKSTIESTMSLAKKHGWRSVYVKVVIDESEED